MEKTKSNKLSFIILGLVLVAVFVGYFCYTGPVLVADSGQYIALHVRREPLYSLFLLLFRTLFGENYYIVGLIQCLLAVGAILGFTAFVTRIFKFNTFGIFICALIQVVPYFMSVLFTRSRVYMPATIMCEGIVMPLFTFSVYALLRFIYEPSVKTGIFSAVVLFVLGLGRAQMQCMYVIWILVAFVHLWRAFGNKGIKALMLRVAGSVLIIALAFPARTLLVKTYNYIFSGYFVNTTFSSCILLTNFMYACDESAGENIEDDLDRQLFYEIYRACDEAGYNYKHAEGMSIKERAEHAENAHDRIKFDYIDDILYHYYDVNVSPEYIPRNLWEDEVASQITKAIMPSTLKQWVTDYFLLFYKGLIRTILIDKSILSYAALLIYLGVFILLGVFTFKKELRVKYSRELIALAVAVLINLAFASSTALVIMCLSRYMMYGFMLFYISLYALTRKILYCIRHGGG